MSTNTAFARLKSARGKITKQQYRTLKGQILAGDVDGAMSDDELCEFLYSYKFCDMCEEGCEECRYHGDCERRLAEWLKQPVKEDA